MAVLVGRVSNKGGRGQRNREEIGAGATFAAMPLLRPARQNRHATQARHFRGFAINTIHQTLSFQSIKSEIVNFLRRFSKLYFGEIAKSRLLKIT